MMSKLEGSGCERDAKPIGTALAAAGDQQGCLVEQIKPDDACG